MDSVENLINSQVVPRISYGCTSTAITSIKAALRKKKKKREKE
jgi:hypothetical protein